jgi:hypothetical protein
MPSIADEQLDFPQRDQVDVLSRRTGLGESDENMTGVETCLCAKGHHIGKHRVDV